MKIGQLNQTNNIEDVKTCVDLLSQQGEKPLVLFNISDVCFMHSHAAQEGKLRDDLSKKMKIYDPENAKVITTYFRTLFVQKLPQMAVDARTASIIETFQNENIPVLGISGRSAWAPYAPGGDNAALTDGYLQSVKINFAKTEFAKTAQSNYPSEYGEPKFDRGILFTSGLPSAEKDPSVPEPTSSEVLKDFLTKINFVGKTILIVNNSKRSLEKMSDQLRSDGFAVTSVHYTSSKGQKSVFNLAIGYLQALELAKGGKVSTDEEVEQILLANPELNPENEFYDYVAQHRDEILVKAINK